MKEKKKVNKIVDQMGIGLPLDKKGAFFRKYYGMLKRFLDNFSSKYPILCFYIVANFINSILLRLFTTGNFMVRPLFFDFGMVLLFGAFSFLIKSDRKNLYYSLTSFLLVAICIINSIYYNYYSSFVSASLISTSVFVKDFGGVVVKFAIRFMDWIYLWVLVGLYLMMRKYKKKEINERKNFSLLLGIVLINIAIGCVIPPYNSFSRLIKLWNRVSVVDTFGVYVYQFDDLIQSLKPTFNNMFGHDEALLEVRKFYDGRGTERVANEYTGIFEGKNVIAIHAESLQNFAIGMKINGREITPNLNKLVKESLYFSNFYAQVGVGTSSDTEFTFASSLLPANNGTVFVNYYNNKFVTMQNLLKDKGYYVFSMHGNDAEFWNRNTMHLNMGYDKFYAKSSFVIDEEYGLGLSDESFFRQAVDMIKEIDGEVGKPYYGTLITLTNHTPWTDADILSDLDMSMRVSVDGKEVVRDYLTDNVIGDYLKSVNYMDMALGKFIDQMENEGLLDDLVLVIYGDHDARISRRDFNYMYNYDGVMDRVLKEGDDGYREFNEYDYELSKKVPLIIWSKDMDNSLVREVKTPMGMIDAMPTIGNMLNIYNEYALGTDIMGTKNRDNVVVFKDGSYITSKIYYSARNDEGYTISNGVIKENYISKNSEYADKIIDISDKIIVYDLLKEIEAK